jgi:hypothetical protein
MNFLIAFLILISFISLLMFYFFGKAYNEHLEQLNCLQNELIKLQQKNLSLEVELLTSKKELAGYKSNIIFGSVEYIQNWFENLSWTPFTANLVLYLGCILTSYYVLGWIVPGLPGIKESFAIYTAAKQKIVLTAAFLGMKTNSETDLEIIVDKITNMEKILRDVNSNFIKNNEALNGSIRAMNDIGHKGLPIPQAQMEFLTESLQHAADTSAEIAARSTIPHLNRPGFHISSEQMRYMMFNPSPDVTTISPNIALDAAEVAQVGISIFQNIN